MGEEEELHHLQPYNVRIRSSSGARSIADIAALKGVRKSASSQLPAHGCPQNRLSAGELLKLQWKDVPETRRLICPQDPNTKGNKYRGIQISNRLWTWTVLQMMRHDPRWKATTMCLGTPSVSELGVQ